jgi:membrane protease YdiL (CAAX protease family)
VNAANTTQWRFDMLAAQIVAVCSLLLAVVAFADNLRLQRESRYLAGRAEPITSRLAWLLGLYAVVVGGSGLLLWSGTAEGWQGALGPLFYDLFILTLFTLPTVHAMIRLRLPAGPIARWLIRGQLPSLRLHLKTCLLVIGLAAATLLITLLPLLFVQSRPGAAGRFLEKGFAEHPAAIVWLVLRTAFPEEVLFRGFFFPRLALVLWPLLGRRRAILVAALVVSAVFALAHTGLFVPTWLRILQALLLGLVLVWIVIRHGIEWGIAFHICFNMMTVLLEAVQASPTGREAGLH